MNATTATAPAVTAGRALPALLLLTAVAHLPATAHHAAESPVLGVTFAAFTTACAFLAVALLSRPVPVAYASAALLCAGAVAAYGLTRTFVLPGFDHDVGHWLDPLGLVSVGAESATALLALRRLFA
ncbi:MAG TPA: hypothetical protein VNA20_08280 [Frankiaceae bacterium]|nr:hypothetical protein [Frankiaceae bacterium]